MILNEVLAGDPDLAVVQHGLSLSTRNLLFSQGYAVGVLAFHCEKPQQMLLTSERHVGYIQSEKSFDKRTRHKHILQRTVYSLEEAGSVPDISIYMESGYGCKYGPATLRLQVTQSRRKLPSKLKGALKPPIRVALSPTVVPSRSCFQKCQDKNTRNGVKTELPLQHKSLHRESHVPKMKKTL